MSEVKGFIVKKYAYLANEACRELFFSISPLYKSGALIDKYNQIILSELFTQLYKTGETILLLASEGNEFEADILVRVLSEGTMKYIYMMNEDLSGKSKLVEEYYDIFPEVQKLESHTKAVEAMNVFENLGIQEHPFQCDILSEEEIENIKAKYSKNYISNLNKRWSYKNILRSLIEKDEKYQVLGATLYSYGLTSHYIHYDGDALRARSEALSGQVLKDGYELDKLHALRIVSNVLSMLAIRVGEYVRQYRINDDKVGGLLAKAVALQVEIDDIVTEKVKGKF